MKITIDVTELNHLSDMIETLEESQDYVPDEFIKYLIMCEDIINDIREVVTNGTR